MNRLFLVAGAVTLSLSGYSAPSSPQGPGKARPPLFVTPGSQRPIPPAAQVFSPSAAIGWNKSPESAEQVASETDKALSWLRNAGAQVNVSFKDKGGHGINQGLVQIKDSKTFRIEYPVLSHDKVANRRDDRFGTKGTLIADGKKMAYWFTGKGYVSEEPLAVSQFTSKVTPAKWISEFPKLIFSALRDGRPFGDLVAAARKPENGLTVAVEERRFDYKNSIIRQSRLTIQKKKSSGSPLFIQVVFDATQKLPVQIQTSSSATGAPAMDVFWVAQWGRPKSGSLNPSTFQIPKLAKKTAK